MHVQQISVSLYSTWFLFLLKLKASNKTCVERMKRLWLWKISFFSLQSKTQMFWATISMRWLGCLRVQTSLNTMSLSCYVIIYATRVYSVYIMETFTNRAVLYWHKQICYLSFACGVVSSVLTGEDSQHLISDILLTFAMCSTKMRDCRLFRCFSTISKDLH